MKTRTNWLVSLALLGASCSLPGCGEFLDLGGLGADPVDCQTLISTQAWQADLHGEDLVAGDSRRASVRPGLPPGCSGIVRSVSWTTLDPTVASVTPVGPGNAASDASAVAYAWVTGVSPGDVAVVARIAFSDGAAREVQSTLRVRAGTPPPRGSFLLTEGAWDVAFSANGHGSGGPTAVVVPGPGTVEIAVDWPDFSATLSFFLYEGPCPVLPCTGRRVIDGQVLEHVKPRRESAPVKAGEFTLTMWGVGTGTATARYEVRFTPD